MCYINSFFLLRFRYVTNFFVLSFPFGTTDLLTFIPKIIIIFLKIGCSQQNEMLNLDLKNNIFVCRHIIGCCYYSTDGIYHSFSSSLLYQQEYQLICCPEMGRYKNLEITRIAKLFVSTYNRYTSDAYVIVWISVRRRPE